jgi:hypothetical protein
MWETLTGSSSLWGSHPGAKSEVPFHLGTIDAVFGSSIQVPKGHELSLSLLS